jgi:hypothetical protein
LEEEFGVRVVEQGLGFFLVQNVDGVVGIDAEVVENELPLIDRSVWNKKGSREFAPTSSSATHTSRDDLFPVPGLDGRLRHAVPVDGPDQTNGRPVHVRLVGPASSVVEYQLDDGLLLAVLDELAGLGRAPFRRFRAAT